MKGVKNKISRAINGMIIQKRRRVEDETDQSDVYDVRKGTVMRACINDPRRAVNKCMHRGKIDVRSGEMKRGRVKKKKPNLCSYIAVVGSYTQISGKRVRKGEDACAVSEPTTNRDSYSYKQRLFASLLSHL